MDIDPRMVTTPIGAAIGVVMARKLLKKDDQTFKNLAIGGGIGGGAGFLAGQYIKGEPGDISTPKGYRSFVEKQLPTGTPSKQEIEALDNMTGGFYGNLPESGGGPVTSFRRNISKGIAPYHNAVQVYKGRAAVLREKAGNPGISEQGRRVLLQAADANERSAAKISSVRSWEASKGSIGAAIDTAGEMQDTYNRGLRSIMNLLTGLIR